MNMMVAGPWSSFFRANASRTNAPRPALGFRTGISRALIYSETMENQGLAVAADGSIWTLTMNSVSQFSHGRARLNKICDYTLYKPSPFGFPQHLAPVNFEHAFFIQSKNNQPVVVEYLKDDAETDEPVISTLAALPDQDTPTAITAASDGSMFVLGRSGKVWQYKRELDKAGWHAIAAPAGTKLLQISVGAADFVLALARKDGLDQLLRLKDGLWIKHDDLPHQGVTWIAACEGKQYWWSSANSQKAGELHLILDGKKLQSFKLEHPVAGLTATTNRSCYFFSFGAMGFMRAALGIVDQPEQNWPAMSPEQTQIYSIMSKGLGILDTKGVRSQYTNINSLFSIWYTKLGELERPAKFNVADWKAVKEQLQSELAYVQVVTTLSVNIGLLNGVIGQLYTNTYNQVIKLMSLPEKVTDQPQALIQVILGQIVDKLQAAAIDKVKEHVGAEAVGIAMACYQYANDAMAKKHKLPDGSVPLTIACSELAATLNEIILESAKVHGTYQEAILTDWGKLSGCGEAIISGIWYWGPKANYEEIKNIGPAIALDFYKALMPVKWKIVLCEGVQSFHPPLNPFMRNVPRYCLMHKSVSDAKQNKIFWWWACMEVGAAVEQKTEGPFPNQTLMEAIFTLPTTPLEFFTGQNGWKLTVATVPGYQPPPEGVTWQPYDNAGSPF